MKKMFFRFTSVYAFSLIIAILLLIFKSRIPEGDYLVTRLLLFGCSVLTGALLFTPRFMVGLLKKISKNSVNDLDESLEDSISWPYIVLFVFILDVFFGLTLLIPIYVIIQSSYILYRFARIYKTLISENPE